MSNPLNPDLEAWLDKWSAQIDEWEKQTGKDWFNGGKLGVVYPTKILNKVLPYVLNLALLGIGIMIGSMV